uniref:Uncharacterized protein n=1 Tax=Panagrolaimus sp. JU765 TaxID=591449 RepID=A0AC34Q0I3_9BILA
MLNVWDLGVVTCSQLGFSGLGWLFFMKQLFKHYEVRQRVVQMIFSVTFALSCTMFELIIFEILDILKPESRMQTWRFALYAMLWILIVFLPLYFSYSCVKSTCN